MKNVEASILISARTSALVYSDEGNRTWTIPISSMLIAGDLGCVSRQLVRTQHPTYHLALRPGYAKVNSFSSLVLIKCMKDFSPGATLPRAAPPCSRNVISVFRRLTKTNLGFKVITLVNLYFPRASAHDKPTWISSIFCALDAIDKFASADGASKLTTCSEIRKKYVGPKDMRTFDQVESPILNRNSFPS